MRTLTSPSTKVHSDEAPRVPGSLFAGGCGPAGPRMLPKVLALGACKHKQPTVTYEPSNARPQ